MGDAGSVSWRSGQRNRASEQREDFFGYRKRTYYKLAYTTSIQTKNKLIGGPTSLFERGGKEHDRALWAMQGV